MRYISVVSLALLGFTAVCPRAEVSVVTERNESSGASRSFRFERVPSPARNDAGAQAVFKVVEGERDRNGGSVTVLNDGRLPGGEDEPRSNFFFAAGTKGGRIEADLGRVVEVRAVNSYSWHPAERGPQVYTLFGSSEEKPQSWREIAQVKTGRRGEPGGQYGVSITNSQDSLGKFRHLRFDLSATEEGRPFAQTFFSEIDVIEAGAPNPDPIGSDEGPREVVTVKAGQYQISIDLTETPDLKGWVETKLSRVVEEWYPKLAEMLPSENYEAPERVTIQFLANMDGVANASGSRIRCAARWMRQNLEGEAVGAVVHELVHVVQQYGRARRNNPNATRTPGWIVEGIPDYIRWFIYEPQTKGAEITERNLSRARYDANYRISANFIDWAVNKYDKDLVRKLNAAAREGKYRDELWTEYTGKTVQELGKEWREMHEARLGATKVE